MVSQKQLTANVKNALKSTGPRTLEGKAKSSRNALKHGILSDHVFMSSENKREFNRFRRAMLEAIAPVGELELLLADRVVDLVWRIRRVMQVEKAAMESLLGSEREMFRKLDWEDRVEKEFNLTMGYNGDLSELTEEQQERAEKLLDEIPSPKFVTLPPLLYGKLNQDDNIFIRLRRYEVQFENSIYRALRQLERIQASRLGHPVLAPLAVDVNLSGIQPENN